MQSFLHSPAWERLQARSGHLPIRHEGQLYLRQDVPGFTYYAGYRLKFGAESTLPKVNATFMRLEPLDEDSHQRLRTLAGGRALVPTFAVQPRQTSLVDISGSEDHVLAAMHPKHRYNIRLAQKKGVRIERLNATGFERFWQLMSTTAHRQDFRTHEAGYYKAMLEELDKDGEIHLLIASAEGMDLAALLLITYEGTATYLHGASSEEMRGHMAPYALHWEAICLARELSCTTYDLWGTHATQDLETGEWRPVDGHASAGVTRFKLGFGGEIVNYPGTFDLILRPFWYSLYKGIRALRGGKRAFA